MSDDAPIFGHTHTLELRFHIWAQTPERCIPHRQFIFWHLKNDNPTYLQFNVKNIVRISR